MKTKTKSTPKNPPKKPPTKDPNKPTNKTLQFIFFRLQINMKLMDPTVRRNFLPTIPEKWKGNILQEKGMMKPLEMQEKKKGGRILSIKAQIHRQRLSS